MKKLIASLTALVLILALLPAPAYAATDEANAAANALYQLGLFQGTGTNADGTPIFTLDRAPTRNEAVTMLVRLLGKEDLALSRSWSTLFTDMTDWAKPYIGYAYNYKLTTGLTATKFGGSSAVTAAQYITFVLRALGYESGTDFEWTKAWELSDRLGFTSGEYNANTKTFTRGDVAIISYNALFAKVKGTDTTLLAQVKSGADVGAHTHDYIEMTAAGHYEAVQTGTKWVEDYVTVIEYECKACHWTTTDREAFYYHIGTYGSLFSAPCPAPGYYTTERKVANGGHYEPVYKNEWVEGTTTIRICSICGQQE